MLILGIETSCDETAIAVVENGRRVISNVVFSSVFSHKRFWGVVPEIAVRAHLQKINWVLKKAGVNLKEVGAIAVTYGPGLIGSLLIGVCFAKGLAFSRRISLIKINHLLAHLYSPFLNSSSEFSLKGVFPAVGMVISGGHTCLIYLRSFEDYQLLGQTRDDAVGEAFDKVAKILNLGYPGGPVIEKSAIRGNGHKIRFNCANLKGFDFSFSGIKTAVLYKVKGKRVKGKGARNPRLPDGGQAQPATLNPRVSDIAASFQKAVIDVLVEKAIAACLFKRCRNLILGGGVTANSYLKKEMFKKAAEQGIELFYPPFQFCTDNASMVAGVAYHLQSEKHFAGLDLTPCADLSID